MEFAAIEHREDPEKNWRRAYHEQQFHQAKQLRRERQAGERRREFFNDKFMRVCDMTDDDIAACCICVARRAIERAIHEHEEGKRRQQWFTA